MFGNAVLRFAGELVGNDCSRWGLVSAGEVELSAFGISHAEGLFAIFMPANDDGLGVFQWFELPQIVCSAALVCIVHFAEHEAFSAVRANLAKFCVLFFGCLEDCWFDDLYPVWDVNEFLVQIL